MQEPTPVFDVYSQYYNLCYQDKNYKAEAAYVRDSLAHCGVKNGNVLEFGCGTGIHGRLLAEMGYRVHGVDRSPEMIFQAKEGSGFTCAT
ncbi:class I SAM-dependent DNA methyltransferase [Candidatus Symbiobacter mobilis]|uniref:Methyltransferase type 11 n=1 Tax=Candidatus Symbiobacter mobilis CR TaxID=946483 RepID=U5ND86_9BURK|nr:class I SAM-dependent methyltransferase [Candidatus Symbiobacter mobilis]AGX88139.1 methyltransferase type 11 [Candidatus Symbiobacter mobilis CR]